MARSHDRIPSWLDEQRSYSPHDSIAEPAQPPTVGPGVSTPISSTPADIPTSTDVSSVTPEH